jgi:hypothetical protein
MFRRVRFDEALRFIGWHRDELGYDRFLKRLIVIGISSAKKMGG